MRIAIRYSILLGIASLRMVAAEIGADGICRATCTDQECTFNAKVNLLAGELGYYQFEECDGTPNPTIGLEMGKTYRFIQKDRSNWYHPLGFSYFADGAHDDKEELEPVIAPPGATDAGCAAAAVATCPAPMYFINGTYLGEYSNDGNILPATIGADNFGLDGYEPQFFHPPAEWTSYGEFSVTVNFPETDGFDRDIFYFCHIHQFMTGRIKLLKGDAAILPDANAPEIPYDNDIVSDFDEECGTFGLEAFQLPHPECPERFVCDVPSDNVPLRKFSSCIDAMNCHMMVGMTTNAKVQSASALFIHQMIPHHQNAVNMAKALLKTGDLACASLDDPNDTDDCTLEIILREIINTQNAQIQAMHGILENKEYPAEDDCKVEILKIMTSGANALSSAFLAIGATFALVFVM